MITIKGTNENALLKILRHFNNLMAEVGEQKELQHKDWLYLEIQDEDEELSTAASEIEQAMDFLYKSLDTTYANFQNWLEETCGIDTEL